MVDGELQLRNPAVMKGYWGMPEETERGAAPDGWLRTGDLVDRTRDGTYTFVGRQKEVIRRRGENVAPVEIEEALAAHPDVVEAAVVGVPSELTEEEIKGFRRCATTSADLAPIRDHAAERLTRFKVPRYLEAVDELPHTPTGRVAKHRLRTRPQRRGGGLRGRMSDDWLRTGIGTSDADSITLMGRDLASELMGQVTFTELTFLLVQKRLPSEGETPPARRRAGLARRPRPDADRAGGAADPHRRAGVVPGRDGGRAARRRHGVPRASSRTPPASSTSCPTTPTRTTPPRWRELVQAGRRVPGLGHPVHKVEDPRTPRIYEIAEETGQLGPHLSDCALVAEVQPRAAVAALPINGAGVAGAALADLGFPPDAAARPRAAGPHGGPARPPRRGDRAPDRDGALPRGRRAGAVRPAAALTGVLRQLLHSFHVSLTAGSLAASGSGSDERR